MKKLRGGEAGTTVREREEVQGGREREEVQGVREREEYQPMYFCVSVNARVRKRLGRGLKSFLGGGRERESEQRESVRTEKAGKNCDTKTIEKGH